MTLFHALCWVNERSRDWRDAQLRCNGLSAPGSRISRKDRASTAAFVRDCCARVRWRFHLVL